MHVRLTPNMRTTLERANNPTGLRRTHTPGPGKPPWPAAPRTLQALLDHNLVDHIVDRDKRGYWRETWKTNDTGRAVLNPPKRPERDSIRLMHCGDTTTRIMVRGTWVERTQPEPEKMAPPSEVVYLSRIRHADAQPSRQRARQLRAA